MQELKLPTPKEMRTLTEHIEHDIIEANGPWYANLDPRDWLFDGSPIKGDVMLANWNGLDWSKAYVDLGPSIMGNLGPYWHVPLPREETVHRLYPKLLKTKWARVFRQAALEFRDNASSSNHRAGEGWRTIDSAPKDGSKVDLTVTVVESAAWNKIFDKKEQEAVSTKRITDAWWNGEGWVRETCGIDGETCEAEIEDASWAGSVVATNWRPLPPPPEKEKG